MTYRWLCVLDYVQGKEHRLSLIRCIGPCQASRSPRWVVVYTLWWAYFIDSHSFVSTFISMFLIFTLWLWIWYEGQYLFVIMHPYLLYIDFLVWQLGKSISCPLSPRSCIIDWVEHRDLLWTFDLVMYHIRSIHCVCINFWGWPADMVLEIR